MNRPLRGQQVEGCDPEVVQGTYRLRVTPVRLHVPINGLHAMLVAFMTKVINMPIHDNEVFTSICVGIEELREARSVLAEAREEIQAS